MCSFPNLVQHSKIFCLAVSIGNANRPFFPAIFAAQQNRLVMLCVKWVCVSQFDKGNVYGIAVKRTLA